jgi:hypothetical protein
MLTRRNFFEAEIGVSPVAAASAAPTSAPVHVVIGAPDAAPTSTIELAAGRTALESTV